MRILVSSGTFQILTQAQDVLFTRQLGACVAVGVVDPEAGVAGLVQYVLPESRGLSSPKGFPAFFAEEGLPLLIQEFKARGGNLARAKVVVAGGGHYKISPKWLDIGAKNIAAARFFLKRLGLFPLAERVGDWLPRRMEVSLKEIRVYTREEVENW